MCFKYLHIYKRNKLNFIKETEKFLILLDNIKNSSYQLNPSNRCLDNLILKKIKHKNRHIKKWSILWIYLKSGLSYDLLEVTCS